MRSIEEENFVQLTEYERKFILGNNNNNENAHSQEDEKKSDAHKPPDNDLLDTTKIPALKLFRLFKHSSQINKSSSNTPVSSDRSADFNFSQRKRLLDSTFSTNHLFSTVLQAASAVPMPKQIRTKNNRKKNLIDTILLYDTKFFHEVASERGGEKSKKIFKELVKEAKSVHFSADEQTFHLPPIHGSQSPPLLAPPAPSPLPLEMQLLQLRKSNSKLFNSVTKSDSNLISMYSNQQQPHEKPTQIDMETAARAAATFNPANNNKLYNKYKRTKTPAQKSKQINVAKSSATSKSAVSNKSDSTTVSKVNLLCRISKSVVVESLFEK